jgi:hypothetical protein
MHIQSLLQSSGIEGLKAEDEVLAAHEADGDAEDESAP